MTIPNYDLGKPPNRQNPHNRTQDDVEIRAIAAIRRLADGQGDPHLAAAIARYIPRPVGRPRAKGPTPAQQRDDLLRRLRRSTFHHLPGIVAAGDILRAWRRYRHGPVLPADEPARTFWRLHELGVSMPAQRSIENILSKHS